ncbi:hypothetical protein EPA93_27220 [Ktedonosporobacter rubrisoli]|uniref:DUF7691 domain-containing protein n=1 Tax=Ktedonosporobacter rubrisoli TaxID=2509675 RepID=A0A4P6JVL1_KTERU|nr:hypothetical protein [Ktedonosporobacter rubrisoli]QBD79475.1 hypothetical protein EPA93_27220 [Ktedonosporobacter rubrisoli]
MGYGLMVWIVDGDRIRKLVGSHDQDTLKALTSGRWKRECQHFNNEFVDDINDQKLTLERAITDIVMGTLPPKSFDHSSDAFVYAYAYLKLCEMYAVDTPSNHYWVPINFAFINQIQAIYDRAGISRGLVEDLAMGGALLSNLPHWSDFPLVGYLEWKEIAQIISELHKVDIDKLVEGHDSWTQGALREVYKWYMAFERLSGTAGERNWTLVGAYY